MLVLLPSEPALNLEILFASSKLMTITRSQPEL